MIVRIAARGDGITTDGRHVAGAAPGDVLKDDGSLEYGSHHAEPPCRHFTRCGGCDLQHCDDIALRQFVHDRVAHAAASQGLEPGEVLPVHLSPPRSRRRCSLHAVNAGGKPVIGFREKGAHRIADMRECHVLRPELFDLVAPLRRILAGRKGRHAVDIELASVDQGVDCALTDYPMEGLEATEAVLDFARENGLARLSVDQGHGSETLWEPEPVTTTLSGVPVEFPSGGFLQATTDGEAMLANAAREWLAECATAADLFAGLGTFSFALAGPVKVLAVEGARDAHLACKVAARRGDRPVHAMHRDLFRNPLQPEELNRFDGVLLDPPRAGAREQAASLAESEVARIVYVSCNPSSWARDARRLIEAEYRLEKILPVGQFTWSTHVELASLFVR